MWSRTYCCAAIPLYNSGIYAIITQFLVVSLVAGILSFAAPTITAVSIPAFGPFLFGAVCIVVAVVQVFGFLGVYREKPALFKTYARVNAILVSIALTIALAFIILSAVRHGPAVTACEALFVAQSTQTATPTSGGGLVNIGSSNVTSGSQICNIWTWVQLGIMGLLFIIIGLCEAYFLMYQSIYLSEQKADHARYNSVYSNAEAEIRQSGLWDHRASSDGFAAPYSHQRSESKSSGLRNELDANTSYNAEREYYRDEDSVPGGSRYDGGYRNSIIQGQGQGYGEREIPYQPQGYRPNFVEPSQNEFDPRYQHPLR